MTAMHYGQLSEQKRAYEKSGWGQARGPTVWAQCSEANDARIEQQTDKAVGKGQQYSRRRSRSSRHERNEWGSAGSRGGGVEKVKRLEGGGGEGEEVGGRGIEDARRGQGEEAKGGGGGGGGKKPAAARSTVRGLKHVGQVAKPCHLCQALRVTARKWRQTVKNKNHLVYSLQHSSVALKMTPTDLPSRRAGTVSLVFEIGHILHHPVVDLR